MSGLSYRKPGVYLEESPLNSPSTDVGSANAAGVFVGVAPKGPIGEPLRIQSWSDYTAVYGGFNDVTGQTPVDIVRNSKVFVAGNDSELATAVAQVPGAQKGDIAFINPYRNTLARFYKYQSGDTSDGMLRGHAVWVFNGYSWEDTSYVYNSYSPVFNDRDAIVGGVVPASRIEMCSGPAGSVFTAALPAVSGTYTFGDIRLWWDATNQQFRIYVFGNAGSLYSSTGTKGVYTPSGSTGTPLVALPAVWNLVATTGSTITGGNTTQSVLDSTFKPASGSSFRPWGILTHPLAPTTPFYTDGVSFFDPPGGPSTVALWVVWVPTVAYTAVASSSVTAFSYLPYAVYSFFQNGGRTAWVVRAASTASGTAASTSYLDNSSAAAFTVRCKGAGAWANSYQTGISVLVTTDTNAGAAEPILTLRVFSASQEVERFQNLTLRGTVPGTRRVDVVVNDPYAGSQYVRITDVNAAVTSVVADGDTATPRGLAGGTDPDLPTASDLARTAREAVTKVEGPVLLNIVPYTLDRSNPTSIVSSSIRSSDFSNRTDVFIIQDNARRRNVNESSATYKNNALSDLRTVQADSRVAAYTPWIVVPDPPVSGGTITIPPGGAIMGTFARIDSTVGVFRAPAGLIASLSNAIGVDVKFNDTELGSINHEHINVIRPTAGAGMCIMGARTRKQYGADRYVSVRRMLIYISEVMKGATEFAVFENNDQRLWSRLSGTADRLLRPLWEAGGLKGANVTEAYYINCDGSINTPQVIASGEVRMEIGVALEIPAEFVVIKVSQFDSGTFTAEIQPA